MITILSTPEKITQVSPAIVSRWLATECPNPFELQRKDFIITGKSNNGGFLELELDTYTGQEGNSISVYDSVSGAIVTGLITSVASPPDTIVTDIPYNSAYNIAYLNDNSLWGGYYFEGKLTVNGVEQILTVVASPDTFGKAEVDVSGVLRIMVSLGKVPDYSALVMAETTKSGKFTVAFRECWWGSDEAYTEEGNDWFYAQAVKTIEEGSNLYEYLDTKFLNLFENPVYSAGLPFDISFILPEQADVSPGTEITVNIKRYNSQNTPLSDTTETAYVTNMSGRVCSLNIDPAGIESAAAYMTIDLILL